MTVQVHRVQASPNRTLRQRELAMIVDHLRNDRFAVLPTDTGPMLACRALSKDAISRLFLLKERPANNPIHVAVHDILEAEKYVQVNAGARRVMELLLPGPLTVICPKKDIISDELVAHTGNLGIRVPDCPTTLAVCASIREPLTATSLNLSGRPSLADVERTVRSLNWSRDAVVHVLEDPEQAIYSKPSTVVRFGGSEEPEILREGPVTRDQVLAAMKTLSVDDVQD